MNPNRAPKLSDDELTALLSAERGDALAAVQATKLSEERERALEYYVGDVSMDIPDVDGRSKAVSMDVADTVEGLMPQLMEIFCSSEEVVKFEPVGPEDVQAADQETDFASLLRPIGRRSGDGHRKPDFQRETNHWSPDQMITFVASFLDNEVIPSLILWKSPTFIFVIDGGHRLSALRAWNYLQVLGIFRRSAHAPKVEPSRPSAV